MPILEERQAHHAGAGDGDDAAHLAIDLDRLLEHQRRAARKVRGAGLARAAVATLSLAVVAAARGLHDRRSRRTRARRAAARGSSSDRQATVGAPASLERRLLARAVLAGGEHVQAGQDARATGGAADGLGGDVLELVGDHIAAVEEGAQPRAIFVGVRGAERVATARRRVGIGVVDGRVGAERHQRLGEHERELAAAEDADARTRARAHGLGAGGSLAASTLSALASR